MKAISIGFCCIEKEKVVADDIKSATTCLATLPLIQLDVFSEGVHKGVQNLSGGFKAEYCRFFAVFGNFCATTALMHSDAENIESFP